MKKVYYDVCESNGCVAIFPSEIKAVPAGTTLCPMSARDKNVEYQRYADMYDLRFIFDDDIPQISFYTVPQVDIFAKDSVGGLFGTVGQTTDIHDVAPICYINSSRECFLVANSLKTFLQILASGCDWKTTMLPDHDIIFFESMADAERSFEFVDIHRGFPNSDC